MQEETVEAAETEANNNATEQDEQEKAEKSSTKKAKNITNDSEPKKEYPKEQKIKNTQEKSKDSNADNQKEKKTKRSIQEIIGINHKKDVIVKFKDSNNPELVKMDEMKSNYSRDLLSFFESKLVLIDENSK